MLLAADLLRDPRVKKLCEAFFIERLEAIRDRILIQHLDSARYCPLECIHTLDSMQVVYTAGGQRKEVKVGVSNDTDAVLLGGLSVGERLYLSMPEHPERFTPISLKQ